MTINNEERAEFARQTLHQYCLIKERRAVLYDEMNTVILDLVVDLLHAMDTSAQTPASLLSMACMHYLEELGEELGEEL